ncbi:MAG: DNA-3-methyladenine glycosylase [Calditrichaceae bacterium]
MINSLNTQTFDEGLSFLCKADPDLNRIYLQFGRPPMWTRDPGFSTLVHIILEQQVSLASAKAAFDKLHEAIESITPENFITLNDTELKAIGFSRQKTLYCRNLADSILAGNISLEDINTLENEPARIELLKLKGIGPWTVDIYLLMALRRPDIWPDGDLALQIALKKLKNFSKKPSRDEMTTLAQPWRPWRAVAARMIWHYYLSNGHKGSF